MIFRLFSDIHNEFLDKPFEIKPLKTDKETCLILAGDVGVLKKKHTWEPFIENCKEQFKYVFWIAGNHEYYHGNISFQEIPTGGNLHTDLLEFEEEKIVVIGATLWSDFDKGNAITMQEARFLMNDFKLIRTGPDYRKFTPELAFFYHYNQKDLIFERIRHYKDKGWKVVVVTHHHPSFRSTSERYRNHPLNGCYMSGLDELINETKPDIWCCGHIHDKMNYQIFDTKIICNPIGYPHEMLDYDDISVFKL